MKSKTIILSSPENSTKSGRGIITIYHENDLLSVKLRLYNISKLAKTCKIGIYHNGEVFSANILEKNGFYTSSMVGDFDFDKDFYIALIDTDLHNNVILCGGTYTGYYFNDNSVFDSSFESTSTDETEESKDLSNLPHENSQHNCANCRYKEYFFNSTEKTISHPIIQTEQKDNLIENFEKNNEKPSILASIIPQFDYIFENYEINEALTSLIPQSKFVTMHENGEEYSIGAIYQNNEIKYICYAIKSNYNISPPEELGEHYQWLPLEKEDPLSEGFYIVFQDAKDLKIIKL